MSLNEPNFERLLVTVIPIQTDQAPFCQESSFSTASLNKSVMLSVTELILSINCAEFGRRVAVARQPP